MTHPDPLSQAAIAGACLEEVALVHKQGAEIVGMKPIILDFTAAYTGKLGSLEGLRFKPMVAIVKDHRYRMTIDPLTGHSRMEEHTQAADEKPVTPQEIVLKLMEEAHETHEVSG